MRMPTYYLSHGGGPWPWMEIDGHGPHEVLRASLAELPTEFDEKPRAILMISAHWVTETFAIQRNAAPAMLYDYGGFPEHTYRVQYRAPGSIELADTVAELLHDAAIASVFDEKRGFDHGMFAPMAVMYPDATIPVVQLSIQKSFDPAMHLAVGGALAPLRDHGILIVGSGLSFHNLRAFGEAGRASSAQFDRWLFTSLHTDDFSVRSELMTQWEQAPLAREAHPQEDHLVPLFVALGAAERDAATRTYHQDDYFGAISASSYRFDSALSGS